MASYTPPPGQEQPSTPTQPGAQPPKQRGVRVSPKGILILVLLAIVLWFVFANTGDMRIKLWVHWVSAPVWLVLLCTFVVGIITGWLIHRRRTAAARAAAKALR